MAEKEKIVDELNQLLADEMVFYQKLRNFHWNVRGPAFFQLHEKFEMMYNASALQVDNIAERILGLRGRPKSTLDEYLKTSRLDEQPEIPNADGMVNELHTDLENLLEYVDAVRKMADKQGDDTTVNLMDDIGDAHEADAWMLRAWLD